MKKILFDLSVCQPIGNTKFHGGGVYGYIVFKALAKKYPSRILAYYDNNRFIAQDIINTIKDLGIPAYYSSDISIADLYKENKFEKIYSPLWSESYFQLFKHNIPILLTQHGLRALEMNRDKYEVKYATNLKDKAKSLLKCTSFFKILQKYYYKSYEKMFKYPNIEVVTVSEHSKASILHFYPFVSGDKIIVCYSPNASEPIVIENGESEKYYLIVSANRWLKNAYRAILAFDSLFDSRPDFKGKVYITGISRIQFLMKELHNRERFKTFDYLERCDLEKLYHNAYALVYPSLNEGFGYPPIEAMRYGTPVISSSFASISEICGEAPLYVNPYSVDEICMRILELEDESIYQKKAELSIQQYKKVEKRQIEDLKKLVEQIVK